ncbi:MAG: XisI protein [Moorea sp. SIOASIH]|nr:XisI protein [Moorena sp. SIOASIH]
MGWFIGLEVLRLIFWLVGIIMSSLSVRDSKIWIHYDGIEDGITDELVATGVPKDRIVLAFHPPDIRQHTGYGIA